MLASLPMYDGWIPHRHTDRVWRAVVKRALEDHELQLPNDIDRSVSCGDAWLSPSLIFSQTCGYPLVLTYKDRLRIVGTPMYRCPGCEGTLYRSAIIASVACTDNDLTSLLERGPITVAANSIDSFSGWLMLLSSIAQSFPTSISERQLSAVVRRVVWTGSHEHSIAAVRRGDAGVASIDAVSFSLAQRHAPSRSEGVRVIGWSSPAPSLPYVTGQNTSDHELSILKKSLQDTICDPGSEVQKSLEQLHLLGVDVSGAVGIAEYEAAVERHAELARSVCPALG
ncbi:unnamed protein product, partial [Ectocarpus fasciculatus]